MSKFFEGAEAHAESLVKKQKTSEANPAAEEAPKTTALEIDPISQVLNTLSQGVELAERIKNVINPAPTNGTGSATRCVLGETVAVGLPDSDPKAWIGQPLVGIRIGSLPDWLDVCSDEGFGASTTIYGYHTMGMTNPAQWLMLGDSDPMHGIAPQGTPFGELSPSQQRAYIANAAAIGIGQNVSNLEAYKPIWAGLQKTQTELGWLALSTPQGQAALASGGTDPVTSTPAQIGAKDIAAAMQRLGRPNTHLAQTTPPPNATPQENLTLPPPTQPTRPTPGYEACFPPGPPNYEARQQCVRDKLAADPSLADFYANVQRPWLETADPRRRAQKVPGLDGRRYFVWKSWGGELKGATVGKALVVGAVATAGVITGVVVFGTERGKAWRQKVFG